jgi:hypothetical protein
MVAVLQVLAGDSLHDAYEQAREKHSIGVPGGP